MPFKNYCDFLEVDQLHKCVPHLPPPYPPSDACKTAIALKTSICGNFWSDEVSFDENSDEEGSGVSIIFEK